MMKKKLFSAISGVKTLQIYNKIYLETIKIRKKILLILQNALKKPLL